MPSLTANRRKSVLADSNSLSKYFERWHASRSRPTAVPSTTSSSSDIGDVNRQQPQVLFHSNPPPPLSLPPLSHLLHLLSFSAVLNFPFSIIQAVKRSGSPQKDHSPIPASKGLEDSACFSMPLRVNVVDWRVVSDTMAIKPHAIYVIMTWHQGAGMGMRL